MARKAVISKLCVKFAEKIHFLNLILRAVDKFAQFVLHVLHTILQVVFTLRNTSHIS